MQELRLVGVHENGGHLLLNGEDGSSYSLPVNEALRMAVARPMEHHKVSTPPPPVGKPTVPMSPREIQARIRSGSAAQDIVDGFGQDLAHVLRYEGPVRAERDYIAILAQRVEVSSALPSNDGYRSAFGENPAQLGEMVDYRLRAYGVDPSSIEWDAWRRPDGLWNVVARFELAADARVSIGEEPPAQWTFNPSRKTVLNTNRWAQLLSELEPLDGPLPTRRLSAVADHVFDFEAQKAPAADSVEDASDNLLDVLRSRRGQRLGADEEDDDTLAHLLAKGNIAATPPRPEGQELAAAASAGSADTVDDGAGPQRFAGLSLAPSADDFAADDAGSEDPADTAAANDTSRTHGDGSPRPSAPASAGTRETNTFSRPTRPGTRPTESADVIPERASAQVPPKDNDEPADRKIRPKRSSVPSWDEIVFGTKGD